MISAAAVSTVLRQAGHRVLNTAPITADTISVRKSTRTEQVVVRANYDNTTYACILAGQLAADLVAAGYIVEGVDEARTFFHVTGIA